MSNKNLEVWDKLSRTDPHSTKPITEGYLKGKTAIAALLPIKMATETFGPVGIGWGYEILDERFDEGEHIYQTSKDSGETVLLGVAKVHTMKVKVWAKWQGETMEAVHFGHTPRLYRSKWGVSVDDEYAKKSLSDAIKKALSMFGVNADIYLGEFEDQDYVNNLRADIELEKAEDKDAKESAQREEYEQWKAENTRLMQESMQVSMLEGLYKSATRKAGRWNDSVYIRAIEKLWREKVTSIVESVDSLERLEAEYKSSLPHVKSVDDKTWTKEFNAIVSNKKKSLTPEESLDEAV